MANSLKKYVIEENGDTDYTDGIFDAIITLSDKVKGEFEDLLEGDNDKKRFLIHCQKYFPYC